MSLPAFLTALVAGEEGREVVETAFGAGEEEGTLGVGSGAALGAGVAWVGSAGAVLVGAVDVAVVETGAVASDATEVMGRAP
jgi:hypothetical protein